MGQKVHPFLFRVGYIKSWHSRWFAKRSDFSKFIFEDYKIRKFIKRGLSRLRSLGSSSKG